MNTLTKIRSSSTFWVSLLLPVLNVFSSALGHPIPWEVVLTGIGAYGVKEAAAKLHATS